jgi:hypothetical protein
VAISGCSLRIRSRTETGDVKQSSSIASAVTDRGSFGSTHLYADPRRLMRTSPRSDSDYGHGRATAELCRPRAPVASARYEATRLADELERTGARFSSLCPVLLLEGVDLGDKLRNRFLLFFNNLCEERDHVHGAHLVSIRVS